MSQTPKTKQDISLICINFVTYLFKADFSFVRTAKTRFTVIVYWSVQASFVFLATIANIFKCLLLYYYKTFSARVLISQLQCVLLPIRIKIARAYITYLHYVDILICQIRLLINKNDLFLYQYLFCVCMR